MRLRVRLRIRVRRRRRRIRVRRIRVRRIRVRRILVRRILVWRIRLRMIFVITPVMFILVVTISVLFIVVIIMRIVAMIIVTVDVDGVVDGFLAQVILLLVFFSEGQLEYARPVIFLLNKPLIVIIFELVGGGNIDGGARGDDIELLGPPVEERYLEVEGLALVVRVGEDTVVKVDVSTALEVFVRGGMVNPYELELLTLGEGIGFVALGIFGQDIRDQEDDGK